MQDWGGGVILRLSEVSKCKEQSECLGEGSSLADKVARSCHSLSAHVQHNALLIKLVIQVSVLIPTIEIVNCTSEYLMPHVNICFLSTVNKESLLSSSLEL
jgi:hypothetical protein